MGLQYVHQPHLYLKVVLDFMFKKEHVNIVMYVIVGNYPQFCLDNQPLSIMLIVTTCQQVSMLPNKQALEYVHQVM